MNHYMLLEGASLESVYEKYYKDEFSWEDFQALASLDPTSHNGTQKGKYLLWIIKQAKKEIAPTKYPSVEEFCSKIGDRIMILLYWFDKHSQNFGEEGSNDINSYTMESLSSFYNSHEDDFMTQSELKGQADIVFNNSEWEIIIPKTWAASKFYGAGTRWCTASNQSDDWFNHYSSEGNLYINIDKRNNTKWQFHFESKSFFDESDHPIHGDVVIQTEMPKEVENWYTEHVDDAIELFENNYDDDDDLEEDDWIDWRDEAEEIADGVYLRSISDVYYDYALCNEVGEIISNNRYERHEVMPICRNRGCAILYNEYYSDWMWADIYDGEGEMQTSIYIGDDNYIFGDRYAIGFDDEVVSNAYLKIFDFDKNELISDFNGEGIQAYDNDSYAVKINSNFVFVTTEVEDENEDYGIVFAFNIQKGEYYWLEHAPSNVNYILYNGNSKMLKWTDENGDAWIFNMDTKKQEKEPRELDIPFEEGLKKFWSLTNRLNEIHKRDNKAILL